MQFGLHISCCNRFLARHVHPLAFCFDDYVNTGNEGNTSPRGLDHPIYIYFQRFLSFPSPYLCALLPLPDVSSIKICGPSNRHRVHCIITKSMSANELTMRERRAGRRGKKFMIPCIDGYIYRYISIPRANLRDSSPLPPPPPPLPPPPETINRFCLNNELGSDLWDDLICLARGGRGK